MSDFAGLYSFTFFSCSLLQKKYSNSICIAIAAIFFLWKSELSQGFIELWNTFGPYNIDRTVDYSDLFALVVIPLAKKHSLKERSYVLTPALKYFKAVIIVISVFSFLATAGTVGNVEIYDLPYSKSELNERMQVLTRRNPDLLVDKKIEYEFRKHNEDIEKLNVMYSDSIAFFLDYQTVSGGVLRLHLIESTKNWNGKNCRLALLGYKGDNTAWRWEKDMSSKEKEALKDYFEDNILSELLSND
ncbi:MAG: hypothetical protein MK172_11680 [Verrucomicrobiales bacterium]|nr:hypothetical protein [Verrucomicrobiales bacterium]